MKKIILVAKLLIITSSLILPIVKTGFYVENGELVWIYKNVFWLLSDSKGLAHLSLIYLVLCVINISLGFINKKIIIIINLIVLILISIMGSFFLISTQGNKIYFIFLYLIAILLSMLELFVLRDNPKQKSKNK